MKRLCALLPLALLVAGCNKLDVTGVTITPDVIPTATITASQLEIDPGEAVTLNAAGTAANVGLILPTGVLIAADPNNPGVVEGEFDVRPEATTVYVFSVAGPGGSALDAVTVGVRGTSPDRPTATINATPTTIRAGEEVTLTLTSTNAESAVLVPTGDQELAGQVTDTPTVTTTYIYVVDGPGGSASDTVTVLVEPPNAPTATIAASAPIIPRGDPVTLTVTSTDATSGVVLPTGDSLVNGTVTVTPDFTTTYTFVVDGPGGTAHAAVTVEVTAPGFAPPTASLTASATTIQPGEAVTLTVSHTGGSEGVLLPLDVSILEGDVVVNPEQTTTYLFVVDGPGGSAFDLVTVTVAGSPAPAPTASITASATTIQRGQEVTLTVSSTDADTGILEPTSTSLTEGDVTDTPAVTTTYIFIVEGPGGSASAAVTVEVIQPPAPPAPTVTIDASTTIVPRGAPVTLAVASTDADHGVLLPTGTSLTNGEVTDTPDVSTTYVFIAHGPGGSASAAVTVLVVPPSRPSAAIEASATSVQRGEQVTLTVSSTDADHAVLLPTGATVLNGQVVDTPEFTTTYIFAVEGPGGNAHAAVTVGVVPPAAVRPTASISADPVSVEAGDDVTLTVTSTNADRGTIVPSAITILNGEAVVNPEHTTTYLFVVDGPGGSAHAAVTVTVDEPPPDPPTAVITADPDTIRLGEQSLLSMSSTNATVGVVWPVGRPLLNGELVVTPEVTTTYFFPVLGPGGTAEDSTTVVVLQPPTATIVASRKSIKVGQAVTLTVTSTDAVTGQIAPIGVELLNGSVQDTPAQTTTYVFTVEGPGGTASAAVTVQVSPFT